MSARGWLNERSCSHPLGALSGHHLTRIICAILFSGLLENLPCGVSGSVAWFIVTHACGGTVVSTLA